jgi:hypothetical protein
MTTIKSPGGSTFPYYYKGGEIHCLHYGSFFTDEEGLLGLIKEEEAFMTKPSRQLLAWVDFYETKLTNNVLTGFAESMSRLRPHILKLAIVGLSFRDKLRICRLNKRPGMELPKPTKYFSDPEDAKTWLVQEIG